MSVQNAVVVSHAVQYAARMVRDGFATVEQAAAVCGIAPSSVEEALKAAGAAGTADKGASAEKLEDRLGWR
jgi:hypothetical protein